MLLEATAAIHYEKEKVRVRTKALSVITTNQAKQEEKQSRYFISCLQVFIHKSIWGTKILQSA